MAIEIVSLPMKNDGSFHSKMGQFTRGYLVLLASHFLEKHLHDIMRMSSKP